jgi:DNA-binding response OmpR family regulator
MAAGFTDYLAKPAGPEVLRETVARLLRESAAKSLEREETA